MYFIITNILFGDNNVGFFVDYGGVKYREGVCHRSATEDLFAREDTCIADERQDAREIFKAGARETRGGDEKYADADRCSYRQIKCQGIILNSSVIHYKFIVIIYYK